MRIGGAALLVPVIFAAALALFPVSYLFFGSIWSASPGFPGSFTLANFQAALSDPTLAVSFLNSVAYSLGASVLATGLAFLLAIAVNKTDAPLKKVLTYSLLVTVAVPWMVEDMSWTYLLSPRTGLYNLWLSNLPGIGTSLLNIYSLFGLVWVMGLSLTPLAYLIVSPSLRLVDSHLEEASAVSGANFRTTFLRIDLPLAAPAVLSAILLCFAIAIEAFDAAAIIGLPGRIDLLTTAIYAATQGFVPDYNLASAYGVILVTVTLAALLLYARTTRSSQKYGTVTGSSGKPKRYSLGRWRWVVGAGILAYILGYPIPVLGTLAYVSLHIYWNPTSPPPLTLSNYSDLLQFPTLTSGILNSLVVSSLAAGGAICLASALAYFSVKRKGVPSRLVELAAFLPFAFPTIVLGVGMLWALAYSPLPLYGTVWALVLAYTVRYVPIATRFLSGPVLQIGRDLEEMSRICGASAVSYVRRIFLPLLKPSILAAALYVFVVSIKDLGAAIMLVTGSGTLFSAALYTLWSSGELLQAAAGGILYVIVLTAVLLVSGLVLKVNLFSVLGAESARSEGHTKTEGG